MDFQIKFEQAQPARALASKLSGEVRNCLFGIGLYSLYKTLLIVPCDLMIIIEKTNATRLQPNISCASLSSLVCVAWWSFNIGGIGAIRWSLMKTREGDGFVMGAGNQYLVLATVVKNAEGGTFIINHVLNYPLGCTIPHTQIILLFIFTYIHITKKIVRNLANATSVEKRVLNTVIVVTIWKFKNV